MGCNTDLYYMTQRTTTFGPEAVQELAEPHCLLNFKIFQPVNDTATVNDSGTKLQLQCRRCKFILFAARQRCLRRCRGQESGALFINVNQILYRIVNEY